MSTRNSRQPISFKIPSTQAVKFSNLTEFKGIEISDNPFTTDMNSASDLLNLYVNESNALSTRPRLQLLYDLASKLPTDFEFIGIYYLNSGYLIHGKEGLVYKMFNMTNEGVITPITASSTTIPINRCKVFEQNGIIYVLDGVDFRKITSFTLTSVYNNGYIPTTSVGKRRLTGGSPYEGLNLLSAKFKESYFWDGSWNPDEIKRTDSDIITNNYNTLKTYTGIAGQKTYKYAYNYINTSNPSYKRFLGRYDSYRLGFADISTENITGICNLYYLDPPDVLPTYYDRVYGDCSPDGLNVAWLYTALSWSSGEIIGGLYVNRNGTFYTITADTTHSFYEEPVAHGKRVAISNDGNMVVSYTDTHLVIGKYNSNTDSFDVSYIAYDTSGLTCIGLEMSESGSVILLKLKTTGESGATYKYTKLGYIKNIITTQSQTLSFSYIDAGLQRFSNLTISDNGDYLFLTEYGNENCRFFLTFLTNDDYEIINNFPVVTYNSQFIFSKDNDKIYFYGVYGDGWFLLNDYSIKISESLKSGSTSVFTDNNIVNYANSDTIIILGTSQTSSYDRIQLNYFDYANIEPLLFVTKTLTSSDEKYSLWLSKSTDIRKSFLNTRFDNKIWFAYKNTVFYNSNNDPSFFSLNNYSDLGNIKEIITGFNLVGDNLLVAYKANHLYLIQGTTINNIYTYLFSESKNTQGNDAYGETIVSSLNEIPIQVSYNGIFGLNQLENIQSSDRITTLISSKVNSKWLKESNIVNCKTLNTLYWTFFFLPNSTITKVYVLDNRTSNWFYWEFPIVVLDVCTKNNKTILCDTNGYVYTLETTDIVRDYDTQYYDYGKKLITWYWISQINPLGTINYLKQLKTTSFIVSDTDDSDGYALNYSFKIFRKNVSEAEELTAEDTLNYITTVTKKTYISRFNFIQLKIANIIDDYLDNCYKNNKINLIGLGYKYILLENTI